MQISRNAAQQNTITKLNQMTDVDRDLKEAERVYNLNKKLYEQKVIGSQEFKQSENNYNYQLQKKSLPSRFYTGFCIYQPTIGTGETIIRRFTECIECNAEKSRRPDRSCPVDGQLTSLDAEIGKAKTKASAWTA
jgi:HlyD family secretion protein